MADAKSEQDDLKKDVQVIQNMIDISAQRLEGLRTQCQTSAELTKQEIRTLEGKLLKLFSDLIVKKSKLNSNTVEHAPSLKLWLKVVGLGQQSIDGICNKISSIEELQEKSEHDLRVILNEHHAATEEFNRLCRALHNLKRYIDVLRKGGNETPDMNLFWDSYDRNHQLKSGLSPRTGRSRAARASVPSEEGFFNNNNNHRGGSVIPPSASVSSINSLNAQCAVLGPPPPPLTPPGHTKGKGMKFPTTPPAKRKLLTGISPNLHPEMYPLTKSKSQDSELTASKTENGDISTNGTGRRARLPTEPGPETNASCTSPLMTSPIKSPPFCNNVCTDSDDNSVKSISLPVPKSPRSTPCGPRVMTHHINHRFNKKFEVLKTCAYCQKPIYLKTSLKCKECKYTCHRHCEDLVPACCGLPPEYLLAFKETLAESGVLSPPTGRQPKPINRLRKPSHPQPGGNPAFQNPDSSSNTSSCNSSTPSSPAIPSINTPHSLHKQPTFHFPDVTETNDEINDSAVFTSVDLVLTQTTDTTRTASLSGGSTSTDSDRTPVRVDSQDSQVSDTDTITDDHQLARQHSLSMREWDIPFHEVVLGNEIGTGRFGTVYQGKWHGDVAVKILNVNYLKDEKTLEQFKMEVATFRKTRHENLILFMGACMKPPQLAIVTSLLSKGNTLYTHIHLRKDKFNMNRTTIVAQQISQGMGYLHAKGIIHKDLKSKNIFLENGKVVITDFGLFSITKLCFGNRRQDSLNIPPGWLCYLAPEIMRSLRAYQSHDEELPFTTASDVYAFGTVWYELLCGEWPFKGQPPEAVIWQVGKGIKQPLANLQASRDVKDILMLCWSFRPNDRPDFVRLLTILDKLPKRRLARSPSHPIHLSRSAESVF